MQLMTTPQRAQLVANFRANQIALKEQDHFPVIKLFTPDAAATWLLSEFDPNEELFFGLCDLGIGFPELGYVALADLETLRGRLGMHVERDRSFIASRPLSAYAREASAAGTIRT